MSPRTGGLATATISFRDEVQELLDERLPSLTESQRELAREAVEEYGSYAAAPPEYERAFDRIEGRKTEARGTANALARFIVTYASDVDPDTIDVDSTEYRAQAYLDAIPDDADAEFVVRELSGGDLALVEDEVAEASFDVDPERESIEGTPKAGFGRILSCKMGIESWPDACPTDDECRCAVSEFSHTVQDFLFERINALNTVGDTNMGNTSLRQMMDDIDA